MKRKNNILRNIPNTISMIRIGLVVLFAISFSEHKYMKSLIIYAAAFFSDVLDGFLARRYNWITPMGKLLDPLADKLMLITALVCFVSTKMIPVWIPIVIGAKEFLMCIGGLLLYKSGVVVEADITGKIATGLWAAGVVSVLIQNVVPEAAIISRIIIICALAASMFAMINYAVCYFGKKTRAE